MNFLHIFDYLLKSKNNFLFVLNCVYINRFRKKGKWQKKKTNNNKMCENFVVYKMPEMLFTMLENVPS